MIGRVDAVANRPAISLHVGDAVAADVVDADVEQVRAVADLRRGRSRRSRVQRRSSIASRKALEPLALVRSPIIRTLASWRNGTAGTATRHRARASGCARAGARGRATALDDRGDVLGRRAAAAADQATRRTRVTNGVSARRRVPAGSAGSWRRSGRARGRPALGMHRQRDGASCATGSAGARSSRPGRWRS